MFLSVIVLFGGITAVLYVQQVVDHMAGIAESLDNGVLLNGFLEHDMRSTSSYQYNQQRVWFNEDCVTVHSYWLDVQSHNIDRSVNGYGVVVVANHVQNLQFAVCPEGGIQVHVEFSEAGHVLTLFQQYAFAEGSVG